MCGIIAVVGKIGSNEERAFKMLLEIDTIRGPHSTGVLSVLANGDMEFAKSVGTPWDLYDSKKFDKMFNPKIHRVLLGHNRHATRGAVTSKNAHPFIHGGIGGVHNGTLTQQNLLADHHRFEVDSDNIYYHMSEHGVDDTVEKLNGAFALAWYDQAGHTFNMTRNVERPLSYCFSDDGKTMFAASEAWMLSIVLSKHTIKHTEPVSLEIGMLVSVDVPNTNDAAKMDKIDQPFIRPLQQHKKKGYPYSSYAGSTTQNTTGTHGKQENSGTTGAATNNVIDIQSKKTAETGDIILLLSSYSGRTIQFFTTKAVEGGSKQNKYTYVIAEAEDDPNVEIRLFVQKDSKLYKNLMSSPNMFSAKVRGYNTYGQCGYLNIDPDTLAEMKTTRKPSCRETKKEEEQKALPNPNSHYSRANFIGPNGKNLTFDQFRYACKAGCVICADPIDITNCHGIEWLHNGKDYICHQCKDSPECSELAEMARQML